MGNQLQDRVAVVTGASSGIGAATARALADGGARVVLAARRADRINDLAADITGRGHSAVAVQADVTDRASVNTLFTSAIDAYGQVDILVNNAGVMPLSPMRDGRVEDWDWMIDVNVRGLLYCVAAALPGMLERKDGHIINVSSLASRRPLPSGVVYAATKFAVRCISDGLRLELSATDHIRVTDIEPGVVATELMDHIPDPTTKERFATNWAEKQSLQSEDVARAVVYAASQPDHVNVNEILVRPTDQPT